MLNTDLKMQVGPLLTQFVEKRLLVGVRRDIHFIDHDIAVGIVAALENRLAIGDVDIVAGDNGRHPGHEPLLIRTPGRNDKGFDRGRGAVVF